MNGYHFFLILLFSYISVLVAIGYYFNKRQTSMREFMLAGRRAGSFSIGFSAAASWLTAGAILAVTGFFMLLGMGSIWGFVAPNIIALLLIALLVKKIRSIPAITQPELIEMRYGSFLRTPVALIIIVVMILFAVADIKGFAMVLEVFYGINSLQAALIVGLSVAAYVSLGGLSAVIVTDTIQYLCLAVFVIAMGIFVSQAAGESSGMSFGEMVSNVDKSWLNPLSVGLPMVLVFCLAIIPGWVTEQDPWQKVWAARDENSARKGMVAGSILVTIVFAGCAVIAMGLNKLYPEIGAMGFPMGMAKAEPALLSFILERSPSDFVIGLCAVALATAAMSCADTFAASGGSCISRDIYQRIFNSSATTKQMVTVNRIGVLLIIGCATLGSFVISSIIEAIHIATFIASSSYFFILLGGLYWKRGTAAGAMASMSVGFVLQCSFVVIDLVMTEASALPWLESIHPLLMGHGVICAMTLSGLVYFLVSLTTNITEPYRLAPFFSDVAGRLVPGNAQAQIKRTHSFSEVKQIRDKSRGVMVYFQLGLVLPVNLQWKECARMIDTTYPYWRFPSGPDSIRRYTRPDVFSCVSLVCGETDSKVWLEIEGNRNGADSLKDELVSAYHEVLDVVMQYEKNHPCAN